MAHAVGVRVRAQGRIVIPAELRKELGVVEGEPLVARVEDGRLVLEKREQAFERAKALFAAIPSDVSLVDELIAERRAAAERES